MAALTTAPCYEDVVRALLAFSDKLKVMIIIAINSSVKTLPWLGGYYLDFAQYERFA